MTDQIQCSNDYQNVGLAYFCINYHLLEDEYYTHYNSQHASCIHHDRRYTHDAITTFLKIPDLVLTDDVAQLRWPSVCFTTTTKVVERDTTSNSSTGYEPYKLLDIVISRRLKTNACKASVISSLWVRSTGTGEKVLFDQLFVDHYPGMHYVFFTVLDSLDNRIMRNNVYSFAKRLQCLCRTYKQQDEVVKAMLGPIVLHNEIDDGFIRSLRKAHGIYDRRISIFNSTICVHNTGGGKSDKWSYTWNDCILMYSNRKKSYERVDERIRWLSTAFIGPNNLPKPLLQMFKSICDDVNKTK